MSNSIFQNENLSKEFCSGKDYTLAPSGQNTESPLMKSSGEEQSSGKIAICISGFIRTWKSNKNSFINELCKDIDVSKEQKSASSKSSGKKQNQIKNWSGDIFVHTYRQNYFEHSSKKENNILSNDELISLFSDLNIKGLYVEDREKILPLIEKIGEQYKNINYYSNEIKESSSVSSKTVKYGIRILDQIRKIEGCNDLRKQYENITHTKYEYVIKTRFDAHYLSSPDWNIIDSDIHKISTLYISYGATGGYPDDICAISIPEVMDKSHANRFSKLDSIMSFSKPNDARIFCAHYIMRCLAFMNNISMVPIINIVVYRTENSYHKVGVGTVNV